MIIVNGKEINLTEDTTVAEYLEQNQYQVKRIAVELNGDILPKYSYSCLLYTSDAADEL